MKSLLIFLFSLSAVHVFSQYNSSSQKQWMNEERSPAVLTNKLVSRCTTDKQKVTAIFNWITDNISYQTRNYNNRFVSITSDEDVDENDTAYKPLDEIVAENVLRRKIAVCDGYARLFKCLCNHTGIACEVITGYGRTGNNRYFRSNHKWNAVYFDSAWHLLDATWAAGYLNFNGTEFIRYINDAYFLTPPQDFIKDHYPDELRWTLLTDAPTLSEFNHSPYTSAAFNKYFINSYSPQRGIIDASVGDSITVELDMKSAEPKMFIADNPFIDSTTILIKSIFGSKQSLGQVNGNKVKYTYTVTSEQPQWLQVIYNDEVIMRYRLNIKKEVAIR